MNRQLFLLAAAFLCWTAPPTFLSADDQRPEIAVMSLNLWHDGEAGKQPLSQTAKLIRDSGADIVGLQEVRKNAAKIAELLGWRHLQHDTDCAVLSRWEISPVKDAKRLVQIRLDDGREILLANVHFHHIPYQPYQLLGIPYGDYPFIDTEKQAVEFAKQARGHEVVATLRELDSAAPAGGIAFLTGDFNEPSHLDWTAAAAQAKRHPLQVAWPTTLALEKAGFQDAYRVRHPDPLQSPGYTWTPNTRANDPRDHHDRIDFVLFRGAGVEVLQSQVVGEKQDAADIVVTPYPTDHRGVVSRFRLP